MSGDGDLNSTKTRVDLPPLSGPVSIRCRRVHSQLVRGWGLEARHSSPWRLIFLLLTGAGKLRSAIAL